MRRWCHFETVFPLNDFQYLCNRFAQSILLPKANEDEEDGSIPHSSCFLRLCSSGEHPLERNLQFIRNSCGLWWVLVCPLIVAVDRLMETSRVLVQRDRAMAMVHPRQWADERVSWAVAWFQESSGYERCAGNKNYNCTVNLPTAVTSC